jgi:hypothetical protein
MKYDKMIKDKSGKEYTWKEFLVKFKKGVEGITPLQQVKSQMNGTYLMIVGLLCGIVVLAFRIKTMWWVEIILVAGLFNTYISLIGLIQKRKVLEQFNKFSKQDVISILNNQSEVENGF